MFRKLVTILYWKLRSHAYVIRKSQLD